MKAEQVADMLARIKEHRDAIAVAHTPENEKRVKSEAEALGFKLIKRRKGEEGFALKMPGSEIDGISIADADKLVKRIRAAREV